MLTSYQSCKTTDTDINKQDKRAQQDTQKMNFEARTIFSK